MRFTTRDLLWLTMVAALGVAWWVDHRRQDWRFEELLNRFKPLPNFILDEVRNPSAPAPHLPKD